MNAAEKALTTLIRHVFETDGELEPLTYRELALRFGRINKHGQGHANGMGKVLEKMGNMLKGLADDWGKPVPHIQSLVVAGYGKDKGLPSNGIKEFWPGYPELTHKEKENRAKVSYRKIREFGSRWNQVLQTLGLQPIDASSLKSQRKQRAFGAGGESAAHRELKEFIARNPGIVGAPLDSEATTEYPLPSLDVIDVLFKARERWVAVEVKSRISDQLTSDYERGLYQCVKYGAILEAMRKDSRYKVPSEISVVLVLESTLPREYRELAKSLGAHVIEYTKSTLAPTP